MARSELLIFCLLSFLSAEAQTDRYMVFFKDKAGTPHSISSPSTFLSPRAIQRRNKAGAAITDEDLPVTPAYVTMVKATGAKTFFTTRWMNGVLVEATASQRSAIEALSIVASTEFVALNTRLLGGRQAVRATTTGTAAATDEQLAMHGLDTMHAHGYRGAGVLIAVLDSGFPGVDTKAPFDALRSENRIVQTIDFVTNSGNVYQLDTHGTLILSVMTASSAAYAGAAPDASYLLYVTEDEGTEYRVEEYNWLFAAERADSAGADIIQSSVGYAEFTDESMNYTTAMLDGHTAVTTRAAAKARDRGIIVVASAGNLSGTPWQRIAPPADADGILSVGAVTITEVKAAFSSTGPSADGRIKPDVSALGAGVSVITADGTVGTASGTSVAAPLVSSLVAGLIEAYPTKTPAELIEAIKLSSSRASSPDNQVGYGIPKYQAVRNILDERLPAVDVACYPNPVTMELNVLFKSPPVGKVEMAIYGATGRVMESASAQVTWANNPYVINAGMLSPGLYVLVMYVNGLRYTVRFVKL